MTRILLLFGLISLAGTCVGAAMPQGAAELGCARCHALDAKIVGPSWTAISARYRAKRDDPATLERLVKNVETGSENQWGSIPMVANDPAGKKREQIVEMVKYILSLPARPAAGTGK